MGYLLNPKYENIKTEKDQNALWIILNRPLQHNAINEALITELSEALDAAEKNTNVRSIVITGAGDKAFSAGVDLTMFSSITPAQAEELARMGQKAFAKIEELSKPVIAGINGLALGGGLELALACDFRVASEKAELGFPEINFGLIPGWGGAQRLARIVGMPKTKEMVMIGNRIMAAEALKIGLVNQVVNSKVFHEKTAEFAQNFSKKSPVALKYVKQAVNFGSQMPLEAGLRLEASLLGLATSTDEFKKALEDFKSRKKSAQEEK